MVCDIFLDDDAVNVSPSTIAVDEMVPRFLNSVFLKFHETDVEAAFTLAVLATSIVNERHSVARNDTAFPDLIISPLLPL